MPRMNPNGTVRLTGAEQVMIIAKSRRQSWLDYIENCHGIEDVRMAKKMREFENKHKIKFYYSKVGEVTFRKIKRQKGENDG